MKNKKSPKYTTKVLYQYAGTNVFPKPDEENNQVLNNIPDPSSYFKFIADPRNQKLLEDYKKQGYSYSSDNNGDNIKFERPTGEYNLSKGFKFANAGMDLVTGIANKIGDIKDSRSQYKQYLESIQPKITNNSNQDGLNSNPIFFQKGGQAVNPIMAEAGEVYQSPEGSIAKIPDHMDTHDDKSGGVQVNDAFRILEDTGDKRSDIPSKLLKLDPIEIMELTGAKTKKATTHSKAFELGGKNSDKLTKETEKYLKLNMASIEQSSNDKYAKNSMELNFKRLDTIPTKGEIFDKLFEHQEDVKNRFNIANPKEKAQTGGEQAFNRRFLETLKRVVNGGTVEKEPLTISPPSIPPFGNEYIGDMNKDLYPWDMDREWNSGVNPTIIRGNQPPTQAPFDNGAMLPPYINNYDINDNTQEKEPFIVTQPQMIDMRRRNINFPVDNTGLDMVPWELNPNNPQAENANNTNNIKFKTQSRVTAAIPQPSSQFKAPLRWYDVATPITSFVDALRRRNVKYNGINLTAPQAKYLNPLPALQEGQRSYNAALESLPDNQVGYGNLANLFGKKYGLDNQVMGQYDNANNGIWNQNEAARVNIRNAQEQSDQQSREVFDNKIVNGLEAQRQQLLRSMNDLTTTIAQNAKYNREGNLLMKLFPNYNQQGIFNGNQRNVMSPVGGMTAQAKIDLLTKQGIKLTPSQKIAILAGTQS